MQTALVAAVQAAGLLPGWASRHIPAPTCRPPTSAAPVGQLERAADHRKDEADLVADAQQVGLSGLPGIRGGSRWRSLQAPPADQHAWLLLRPPTNPRQPPLC